MYGGTRTPSVGLSVWVPPTTAEARGAVARLAVNGVDYREVLAILSATAITAALLLGCLLSWSAQAADAGAADNAPVATDPADPGPDDAGPAYTVRPVGWVRRSEGRTYIEIEDRYRPALLGLDAIWVIYWFDRNDTLARREILQVHPRGDPANPLRGVFATRAPVRPNLIALSRCRVLSVRDNLIEIDEIDAFTDTPVLDLKP